MTNGASGGNRMDFVIDSRPCVCCIICGNTRKQIKDDKTWMHAHVFKRWTPATEEGKSS